MSSERMECRASVPRTLGLCVLAILMTTASYSLTWLGEPIPVIVGWIGAVFFGLCTVRIYIQALQGGPRIIISDLGIEDRRTGLGLIRWKDIREVRIQHMKSNRFMCIDVEEPERYLADLPWYRRWLARANAALGFSKLTLNFSAMTPGLDEAMAFIHSRYLESKDEL